MPIRRTLERGAICCSVVALAACSTGAPPPPPPVIARPATFTPLGIYAPYLTAEVVNGRRARAAKLRGAGIRPLSPAAAPAYLVGTETELRRQTAGIGLDVIRLADGILIRIPAAFTFETNSAEVKPQFDATLLEIARTVKAKNQTYVDVLAHTDTTGAPQYNQNLSERRASAVASFLSRHGVARARIASRGLGETAPLHNPDLTEAQKAANRRVEIRLVPFRTTDTRR